MTVDNRAAPIEATEYLTPPEAAAFIATTVGNLQAWRVKGIGPPFIKLGPGRMAPVRYWKDALRKWMNSQEETPAVRQNAETAARRLRRP